jgi:hypothetical protein
VVDLGAGMGAATFEAVRTGASVVAVDPAPYMRSVLHLRRSWPGRAAVTVLDGAAESIPVADGSIDALWTVNTIHHWTDRERASSELARVVRPGGRVLLVDEDLGDSEHPWHKRGGRALVRATPRRWGGRRGGHAVGATCPGLAEYLAFLREHRGFSARTVARQQLQVGRMLAHLGVDSAEQLERITADQIDRYLVHAARGLGRQSIGAVCASIRGFLGHLHLRGILHSDLRTQVATPHLYALENMPRAVAWSDIERTLGAIDRDTEVGCRDYGRLTPC